MINDGRCPYCFRVLDEKDLAYELHFYEGYTEEDLSSELLKSVVKMREDKKFKRQWGAENRDCERYMLYESHRARKDGKIIECMNGMERLLRKISLMNQSEESATVIDESEELEKNFQADMSFDSYDDDYEDDMIVDVQVLPHEGESSYTISEDDEDKLLAWPCCSECHTMLPIGWFQAENFLPISLIAPVAGGKTTFLLSLIGDNQRQLNMGQKLHFTIAHNYRDPFYREIKEAANNLYKGKYPKHTAPLLQAPIFFNLTYNHHNMMIGIYDASGESLQSEDPDGKLVQHTKKVDTHIYLINPEDMQIQCKSDEEKKILIKEELQKICKVLDLENQGKLQQNNQGVKVLARDIIYQNNETEEEKENYTESIFDLLMSTSQRLQHASHTLAGDFDLLLANQHIAICVAMSDKLKETQKIENIENGQAVFSSIREDDILNIDKLLGWQKLMEKTFKQLLSENDKDILNHLVFGEKSYHFISATGCGAIEEGADNYVLEKPIAPIRVAEPLLYCVWKRIEGLGWTR